MALSVTLFRKYPPSFDGFGVSDSRLNEHSDLTRGCGGVGIIWRRSLLANPVKRIVSDHFCVIELFLSQSQASEPRILNVISVYLPSSDHPVDEFAEYLTELTSIASAIESSGPILLLGDFNAHLPSLGNSSVIANQQGNLLLDFIQHQNFFVASTCSIAKGPSYTYFSGTNTTTVDYIVADSAISSFMVECFAHDYHALNLSDHLPLTIIAQYSSRVSWFALFQNKLDNGEQ